MIIRLVKNVMYELYHKVNNYGYLKSSLKLKNVIPNAKNISKCITSIGCVLLCRYAIHHH